MGNLIKGFTEKRNKQLRESKDAEILYAIETVFENMFDHHYILLKDEGYSFWWECPACGLKFESDLSGMNCVSVITENTGPTGRGRTAHWEPACPKCFELERYRE